MKLTRYKVRALLHDGREIEGFAHSNAAPDDLIDELIENYFNVGLHVKRILSIAPHLSEQEKQEQQINKERAKNMGRFYAVYNLRRRLNG